MAEPEHHPLEHIVTIRRLLEHYEEGFAFIKELVQNADDALNARQTRGAFTSNGINRMLTHPSRIHYYEVPH